MQEKTTRRNQRSVSVAGSPSFRDKLAGSSTLTVGISLASSTLANSYCLVKVSYTALLDLERADISQNK